MPRVIPSGMWRKPTARYRLTLLLCLDFSE
nr:MAG TPA: hypothetical protein [Caudoviricetes sp.]